MNKEEYIRGLNYVSINIGAPIGEYISSDNYFESIALEIEKLKNNINAKRGNQQTNSVLGGFLAEFWHSGTYNINSAVQNSTDRATVLGSHDFASVDVKLNSGNLYNLKYYQNSMKTARAISTTYEEYFKKNRIEGQTFEEFFKQRGITVDENLKHECIYLGQYGLVPSDQYTKMMDDLKRMILTEKVRRPELVKKLEDAMNSAVDKITGPDGVESICLTKEQSEELAKLARKGGFNPEDYGLTLDALVDNSVVFKRALTAGASAALVSALMKVVPYLISAVKNADSLKTFCWEDFAENGIDALTSSGKSFVIGAFTSAINDMCKKKLIPIRKMAPEAIGTLVALTITIVEEFVKAVCGKQKYNSCVFNCMQSIYIAMFGMVGSIILSALPMGIVIGNILGCIIGGFAYNTTNKLFISYCIESGFTCFGLVEQDYCLPECILKDLSFDLIETDSCDIDKIEEDMCELDECEFAENDFDNGLPYSITRGVIEVNKIGYVIV